MFDQPLCRWLLLRECVHRSLHHLFGNPGQVHEYDHCASRKGLWQYGAVYVVLHRIESGLLIHLNLVWQPHLSPQFYDPSAGWDLQ